MSVQIKCKNIITNEEIHFDCLNDCLNYFGIRSKATIMTRVHGKNDTVWRDTWIFAFEYEEYHKFEIRHYDPSCRKGRKTILKSENETLTFNSSAKAIEFLKLKNVRLTEGMIINGYTVIFP